MLNDIFKSHDLPENLPLLVTELEMVLKILNNPNILPVGLDTAERYLAQLVRRWNLGTKERPDPITCAIYQKIIAKRNEFQVADAEAAGQVVVRLKQVEPTEPEVVL